MRIITAEKAARLIKSQECIATSGFAFLGVPEEILSSIEKRYLEEDLPKNLTLIFAAAQGDGREKGLNHLAHEGLVKKIIGGHFNLAPKLGKMIIDNKVEAYNLPQGVIVEMLRDVAGGKSATITKVGLNTFVDPRLGGGKINNLTKQDIVEMINILGEENLLYKCQKIDTALIKASYADESGNISLENEATLSEAFIVAQSAKNCGGKVIVQIDEIIKKGHLNPRLVTIPGIYVDYVVVSKKEYKMQQVLGEGYDKSLTGDIIVPVEILNPIDLNIRKIIARRAAMELKKNSVVNLGIGIPEAISSVANEEGIAEYMTLTVESGPIGGVPQSGARFGSAINPICIIDSSNQFNFYNGGGLDQAFLGLAQVDESGNVNVSKFGERAAGCGGFINISQNSKQVIFCGTFTADGLKVSVNDGKVTILREGHKKKFIKEVEQITFSGKYAKEMGNEVIYITERAVFKLKEGKLHLTEIAPGIHLGRDILELMEFTPIIDSNLKLMDRKIFNNEIMGLDRECQ